MSASYISIGLFASSITGNQIVAFLIALFIGIFFHLIFGLLASSTTGWIAGILDYLSLSTHYESMARGVIDSKDIIYFLSIIFLGLTGTDSTGTRVVVEENGEVTADFLVGRISFSQAQQPQGYSRNQNTIIKSHLRVEDDERVYQVDGFLSMMFSDKVAAYRDKTICRFDKELPVRLTFTYPGDSSLTLVKNGMKWMLNNLPADSVKVATYLGTIATSSGSEFAASDQPIPEFPYTLRIEGDQMQAIEIRGAKDDSAKIYFIQSSADPSALFRSTSPSLFSRIFVSREKFI